MYQYYFEKMIVWKDAIALSEKIYKLTKEFPQHERYGLSSQLQRASISISANIAEGCSRSTKKDQAHFSMIAYSSTMEVLNLTIVAYKLGYIDLIHYESTRKIIEKISNQINALRNTQLKNV